MAGYDPTIWSSGDVITAAKFNNTETQYEEAEILIWALRGR